MRCSIALVAALWLAFGAGPRAAEEGLRLLPFQLQGDGDIVVPVTIDGGGPFDFLLDTGSSRTIVSDATARRLGLQIVAQTLMVTPLGEAPQALAPLNRVAMGAGPPATVLAMIVPADALDRGRDIDGIIGQDILARRSYTIDYERRHLAWHSASTGELGGARLPLELREGRLLVSLPQRQKDRTVWPFASPLPVGATTLHFIPDSGADGFVLFARPGRALPAVSALDTAGLRTLSGHRAVRRVVIDALDVGDIRLRNQTALIVDGSDAALGDGLLPLHLFARVTFNGPQRLLIVEAR